VKEVKEFTIKRGEWCRGGNGISMLLNRDEKKHNKCCLGFYALACGFEPEMIAGRGAPVSLLVDNIRMPEWLLEENGNSCAALHIMLANDSAQTSEEFREGAVAEIFARHGVTVHFED
jgi:hypothetical protein